MYTNKRRATTQILKVIEYARAQAYVNADRELVVGQSFGGASAIAVAAKKVDGVVAAVNFAVGGSGDPTGRPDGCLSAWYFTSSKYVISTEPPLWPD